MHQGTMTAAIPIDSIIEAELLRRGVPPCLKCGKPCTMFWTRDECDHETDHAAVDAWCDSRGLPRIDWSKANA